MYNKRIVINELFSLRAIACLAVLLLHSVSSSLEYLSNEETVTSIHLFQLLLMFGTPTFVFISEVLIAHSYSDKIPNGFFRKRLKFIFIPYVVMGIFYAGLDLWVSSQLTLRSFLLESANNVLLGRYHGYFILIIFQFYILHFVFQKYIVNNYSPKFIISVALLLNVGYLGIFNALRLPETANVYLTHFWNNDFKLLFLGWIFYFTLAFYCGKKFNTVKEMVNRHISKVVILLGLSVLFVMFNYFVLGFGSIHSKRFDIIFYTISVIGVLTYYASKLKKAPDLIMLISRYSFGIYLLHPFFITIFERYEIIPNGSLIIYILVTFIFALIGSVLLTYLLNKTKLGVYAVGKVKSTESFFGTKQKDKATA